MTQTKAKTPKLSKWQAIKPVAIYEVGYLPGDRLTEEDVARLPVGRIETMARTGFVRRVDD